MKIENLNKYRDRLIQKKLWSGECKQHQGCFRIPHNDYEIHCIMSNEKKGLHISLSRSDRVQPTNDDITYIRELFFDAGDALVRYYYGENENDNVIHLWKQ